jgi:sugar porter (SP) family MFS transporter
LKEHTSQSEHSGTNFPYLLFISCVAALGGFLFGYDTAVISGTIGQVTRKFGLDTIHVGWYVSSALVGSIAGVLVAGLISDYFGRKKAMILSAVFFTVSALGCAIAGSFTELVLYRIVGGVGIGMISIVSPMYISEVAIPRFRGALVSLYQLAITVGFLGAYLANYGLLKYSTSGVDLQTPWMQRVFVSEEWRGMLGMEALPAMLFLGIIFFVAESPRWLVMKGSAEKARRIMLRINSSLDRAQRQLTEMKNQLRAHDGPALALMKHPSMIRAVAIGAAIAILGQFMGVNAVLYYGPSIFMKSGLSGNDALFYQAVVGGVNAFTTIIALLIIDKLGRKTLVYFGVSGMFISLIVIAVFFVKGEEYGLSSAFLFVLFLLYIFFTAISISAVIFVFLSEMYPTAIRGVAMSISGFSLWVGTFLIGQLTPWLLDNLTAVGTFLLFAFMCIPYLYIVRNLMPETAGKSLEEIERYWFKS